MRPSGKDGTKRPFAVAINGWKNRAFCRTCMKQGCGSSRHRRGDVRCTMFAERLTGHRVMGCVKLQALAMSV